MIDLDPDNSSIHFSCLFLYFLVPRCLQWACHQHPLINFFSHGVHCGKSIIQAASRPALPPTPTLGVPPPSCGSPFPPLSKRMLGHGPSAATRINSLLQLSCITGIRYGFRIGLALSTACCSSTSNSPFALENNNFVDAFIGQQIAAVFMID